jgi:hypothetical protein
MDPTVATIGCIILILGIAPKPSTEGNSGNTKHSDGSSKQPEQPEAVAEQAVAAQNKQ